MNAKQKKKIKPWLNRRLWGKIKYAVGSVSMGSHFSDAFVGSSYRQNRWLNYCAYKFCIFQLRMHRSTCYTSVTLINCIPFGHGFHAHSICSITKAMQSDNIVIMNTWIELMKAVTQKEFINYAPEKCGRVKLWSQHYYANIVNNFDPIKKA